MEGEKGARAAVVTGAARLRLEWVRHGESTFPRGESREAFVERETRTRFATFLRIAAFGRVHGTI